MYFWVYKSVFFIMGLCLIEFVLYYCIKKEKKLKNLENWISFVCVCVFIDDNIYNIKLFW